MPQQNELTIGFHCTDGSASFAALTLKTSLATPEEIKSAIAASVTEWAKDSIAGESALRASLGVMTIADLFQADAFEDPDLRARLARNGVELVRATIAQPDVHLPYETVLTDRDQLTDDYGVSIFCERSIADEVDVQTETETIEDMAILDLDDIVLLCKKYGIDRASMDAPQDGVALWFQSTTPPEDAEFFEQGIRKQYSLHIHSVNADAPTPEDYRRIARAIGAPFQTALDKLIRASAAGAPSDDLVRHVHALAAEQAALINSNGYLEQSRFLQSQSAYAIEPRQQADDCVRSACLAQAERAIGQGFKACIEFIKSAAGESHATQFLLNQLNREPKVEDTLAALASDLQARNACLDEITHDAAADLASSINNRGIHAQLTFLRQTLGAEGLRTCLQGLQEELPHPSAERPRG